MRIQPQGFIALASALPLLAAVAVGSGARSYQGAATQLAQANGSLNPPFRAPTPPAVNVPNVGGAQPAGPGTDPMVRNPGAPPAPGVPGPGQAPGVPGTGNPAGAPPVGAGGPPPNPGSMR